jgi:hypothetical protein
MIPIGSAVPAVTGAGFPEYGDGWVDALVAVPPAHSDGSHFCSVC